MSLTESQFRISAEDAIAQLEDVLFKLCDEYQYDVDRKETVLEVCFEEPEPGTFIISPNVAARQIWVSARATSHKFDWSEEKSDWLHERTGEVLTTVISRLLGEQLGVGPDLLR